MAKAEPAMTPPPTDAIKRNLTKLLEWIRPAGIALIYFFSEYLTTDPVAKFHILGPWIVVLMSGTVGLESLFLGKIASKKVGYAPNRAYQVQSGLNNLATALTALLVIALNWGLYADAAITTAMLIFFTLSAANHALSAIREHNFKPVNLMRPLMTALLIAILLPAMLRAFAGPPH